jgi:hypothetical protein
MPNFLAQIQELDTSLQKTVYTPLDPRRHRREKARQAAKSNKSAQRKAG